MNTFRKIRFTSAEGSTAGLVIPSEKLEGKSISEISRLFPYSESRFMRHLEVSEPQPSFESAFAYEFSPRTARYSV
jgi:hypothetical protein